MDTSEIENILKEAMGLNVSSIGNASIKNAIQKRMSFLKAATVSTYSTLLTTTPAEVNALIEEVSVTETWFFRDNLPFAAMADFARKLSKDKNIAHLRILSLPCATGEEPYSIAISLLEAGFQLNAFQIDAVDINNKALDIAKQAVYGNNSFRAKGKEYLKEKYFEKTERGFALKNTFKKNITFRKGNLVKLSTEERNHDYHIIFCRNLLIYLNSEALTTSLQTLDKLLAPRGLLFVGHAEPGIFTNSLFTPSSYQKTFSLVRREDPPVPPHIAPIKPHVLPTFPKEDEGSKITPEEGQPENFDIDKILAARLLLHKKQYHEAIVLCEEHIRETGPTADAFFWLARGVHKVGEHNSAVELLRRTIYLDPDHLDAMKLLSQIYTIMGDEHNRQKIQNRILRVRERLSKAEVSNS